MWHPSASVPPYLLLPRVERIREVRVFFAHNPLTMQERPLFKGIGSHIHSTSSGKSLESCQGKPFNMASVPSSSSRPHGFEKGNWERCSVPHEQLVKLQTQGFLPPADLVPVRAGLASFTGEVLAENFPNPTRGNGCASCPTC